MDVIHEGVLEIGIKPESRSPKDWKPRLFVLKRYLLSERSTLDYYKNTSKRWQKQSIKGVISLWPHFELSIAHLCSYKYSLKLTTSEHTVYLAASTAAAMNKWYYFIQTQEMLNPTHDMYIFNVMARDSDAMNLLGAVGDCQLVLTPEYQVKIVSLPKKEVLCVWPFDCLKTFSCGGGLFSFTSGRHAPHGPGDYSFITSQDRLIHDTLQKRIDKARRNSTASSNSSSHLSISDRPPAKLPLVNQEESSSGTPTSSSDENNPPPHYTDERYTDHDSPIHPPPLPNQPPPKIPPKGSGYKTWLHDRYGSSLEPATTGKSSDQSSGDLDADHVYSHTIHRKCPPNTAASTSEGGDPAIYNALVHQGLSKRPSQNYDIAYPKAKTLTIKGSESYSFIKQDDAKNEDVDTPLSPPPVAPLSSPDGMTANPLYGSSGNLLEAVTKPVSQPLPPQPLPVSDATSQPRPVSDATSQPRPVSDAASQPRPLDDSALQTQPSNDAAPEPLPSNGIKSRPDVTANPTYVTTAIKPTSDVAAPMTNHATPTNNGGVSLPVQDTPSRDTYSEVTKPTSDTKGLEDVSVPSSVGSDPPPIPERIYSMSDLMMANS